MKFHCQDALFIVFPVSVQKILFLRTGPNSNCDTTEEKKEAEVNNIKKGQVKWQITANNNLSLLKRTAQFNLPNYFIYLWVAIWMINLFWWTLKLCWMENCAAFNMSNLGTVKENVN